VSPEVIAGLVRLVANGRKFRVDDAVVIEHLIEMGVPKEHAAELLSEISEGLHQGHQLATTGTGEAPTHPPASPLYVAAFLAGQQAVTTEQKERRLRSIVMSVIAVIVLGAAAYFALR
jgi:hypothetical protein